MRRRSQGSRSGGAVAALALGACQSIIGISGYEIDRSLDDDEGAGVATDGGATSSGAKPVGGGGGDPGAGAGDTGEGGHGEPPRGGNHNGGSSGDCAPADCDDDIACTVDTCTDGTCENTPDTSLCVAADDECVTCRAGIGCVLGESFVEELLLDPSFDASSGDWVEYSDNFANNVFMEAGAQSGTRIARFGPAPLGAAEQEYADLLQHVTVPERTVSLTFSGYYQLAPGAKKPSADYLVAAFYEIGGVDPYAQFHSWGGDSGARAAWTAFSYDADRPDLRPMWGVKYTFDLVARTWDSVYRLDSLSLSAKVCKD
jgi:hypothetical protein